MGLAQLLMIFIELVGVGLGLKFEYVLDGQTRNQELARELRLSAGKSVTIASP